jgi:prefoldin subunit 5
MGVVRIDDENEPGYKSDIDRLEAQREAIEVEIQSLSSTYSSLRRQLEIAGTEYRKKYQLCR